MKVVVCGEVGPWNEGGLERRRQNRKKQREGGKEGSLLDGI